MSVTLYSRSKLIKSIPTRTKGAETGKKWNSAGFPRCSVLSLSPGLCCSCNFWYSEKWFHRLVGTVTVIFCYYLFYKQSLFLLLETQVKLKQKIRKCILVFFFFLEKVKLFSSAASVCAQGSVLHTDITDPQMTGTYQVPVSKLSLRLLIILCCYTTRCRARILTHPLHFQCVGVTFPARLVWHMNFISSLTHVHIRTLLAGMKWNLG